MASIFSLFGEVLIDNTNANKAIDNTTEKAEKSGSKVGGAFKSIAKGAVAVGTAVVGAATTVGGAALKMTRNTSAQADEVDKMSQKLGMSRTAYQEWDYVLSQAGVEITSMATGMKTLTNKIDDAKNGSEKAQGMFNKFGISMEDLRSMSREDIFAAVINGMQSMEDSTERAALANDLFGKSGQELTALFNESAKSTEALKQKAHELGMVMSDETIDAGVKFTDTMDTLKRSFGGVMAQLGGAVIPIVQKFADLIQTKMPQIQDFIMRFMPILAALFDGVLPPLFELAEAILPVLFDLLESLLPVFESLISAILPVIVDLIQQILPFVVQIVQEVLPIFLQLIEGLMPLITQIIQTVLPVVIQLLSAILPPVLQIVQTILPVLLEALRLLLPSLLQIAQAILPVIVQLINAVLPVFMQIVQAVLPVFKQLIETLLPPLSRIIDALLPVLVQLFNSIMPVITSLVEAFLPILTSLLDALLPVLQPILDLLTTLLSPLFDILESILPPLCDFITTLTKVLLPPLEKAFSVVSKVISGVFRKALENLKPIFDSMKKIFKGIVDFITGVFSGDWKKAWNGIVAIFKGIFNLIPTIGERIINGLIKVINGIIDGIAWTVEWTGIEIPRIPSVELPRFRIGLDYVPYDEFAALLHKGERVLTASEAKEYDEYERQTKPSIVSRETNPDGTTTVIIQLGERSIVIENLNGRDPEELDEFVDEILEMIAEKIKRKGVVFE